jgi:DNA-binding IclR family transcriptional regulator
MKDDASGVRAVERALDVLGALAAADTPQTLTAIAAKAGLSLPTTLRLLRTLRAQRVVVAVADGRYLLGARVLEFSHAYLRQLDVVSVARPFLTVARDRVNETVALVVRSGDVWVPIVSIEATQPIRRVTRPGETTPLYASGTGKLLLAGESDEEIDAYLARTEMVPFSNTTVVDPAELRAQIADIRVAGYSCSVNERGAGGVGVSAPIRDHAGSVVAGCMIAAPVSRFTPDVRAACIEAAVEAAADISRALGYDPAAGARPTPKRRQSRSDPGAAPIVRPRSIQ